MRTYKLYKNRPNYSVSHVGGISADNSLKLTLALNAVLA